ncbi:hypothetical protein J7E52_00670 [Bacillus sp. ISL-34]|nr:hypothetical protein [Bacillus sp. ISL-34]MBT2645245.1 hypothetical protein [Bacillus sp. ISL-34]
MLWLQFGGTKGIWSPNSEVKVEKSAPAESTETFLQKKTAGNLALYVL